MLAPKPCTLLPGRIAGGKDQQRSVIVARPVLKADRRWLDTTTGLQHSATAMLAAATISSARARKQNRQFSGPDGLVQSL
jgi:hypothetical protein